MTLYLSRDKNGDIYFSNKKPYKRNGQSMWYIDGVFLEIPPNEFKSVKWDDDQPTKCKVTITK